MPCSLFLICTRSLVALLDPETDGLWRPGRPPAALTSPTYFCTSSLPMTLMKQASVRLATARASSVFPVPAAQQHQQPRQQQHQQQMQDINMATLGAVLHCMKAKHGLHATRIHACMQLRQTSAFQLLGGGGGRRKYYWPDSSSLLASRDACASQTGTQACCTSHPGSCYQSCCCLQHQLLSQRSVHLHRAPLPARTWWAIAQHTLGGVNAQLHKLLWVQHRQLHHLPHLLYLLLAPSDVTAAHRTWQNKQ